MKPRSFRNRYILAADLPAIALAALGAFVLRFDWLFYQYRAEVPVYLLAALLLKPPVFHALGLYRRYWRYASIDDLKAVVVASAAASLVMAVFVGVALPAQWIEQFSRSVLVIDALLTLLLAGGLRISVRVLAESRIRTREALASGSPGRVQLHGKRVLVVGAGDAGTMVVREMQRNPQLHMEPIGFLDDDAAKHGKQIYGLPVLGSVQSLTTVVRNGRVDEVVIAMPRAGGAAVRVVVEMSQALKVPHRTIPGVFELLDGQVAVSRLRHVEITDLLRRSPVAGGTDASQYVTGHTVLVTGAGGSIGTELCRQVAHLQPSHLVMLGHGENSLFDAHVVLREAFPKLSVSVVLADIRDRRRLEQQFARFRPSVVFHAAAHKHVHLTEDNFEDAITTNVVGTQNLVHAALMYGTEKFVAISTDKAVSPAGIMGASKRVACELVRGAGARTGRSFVSVRFGNVLGSRGSIVPLFKAQIERGGPVTITHPEMKRFFMTIPEAVHLVLQAGGIGSPGELFVLKMGEPLRIIDVARDLIRLSGFTLDQIAITMTGIRPGEKLEEILWESDAITHPTSHPDILKVSESSPSAERLDAAVQVLAEAAAAGDRMRVDVTLAECIPTYAPSLARVASFDSALN